MEDSVQPLNTKPIKEIKWSYSRLSCYGGCPFRYKLQYVDGNYPKFGNIATEFGSAIHAAEETIANHIKAGETIDYITIKNTFIIACAKVSYRYFKDWWSVNKDSGKTYEEQKLYYLTKGIYRLEQYMKDHPTYVIDGAEVKIDYYYKGNRFIGSIDRLIFDTATNSYIVQDIKSWPCIDKHKDELKTPVQLAAYSLALAEMRNCKLESISCQYDLPLVNEIFDAGKNNYIEDAMKTLDEEFSGIAKEDWTPNPKPLCAWCPFSKTNPDAQPELKHLCPYHSIWDRDVRNPKTSVIPEFRWKGISKHEDVMQEYLKGSE